MISIRSYMVTTIRPGSVSSFFGSRGFIDSSPHYQQNASSNEVGLLDKSLPRINNILESLRRDVPPLYSNLKGTYGLSNAAHFLNVIGLKTYENPLGENPDYKQELSSRQKMFKGATHKVTFYDSNSPGKPVKAYLMPDGNLYFKPKDENKRKLLMPFNDDNYALSYKA